MKGPGAGKKERALPKGISLPSTSRKPHTLHFLDALPPYLGGKRRLSPLIFAALSDTLPRSKWHGARLADPFCGGGAVALHAKARGFEVIASDIALRAVIPARALVANSHTKLHRSDIVALFLEPDCDYPRVASEHAPGRLPVRAAE